MVSVEDAVIARIHKEHKLFEILVDPDLALEFRKGKPLSVDNILAVRGVFVDAKKGDRAADDDLSAAFGTTDTSKVAEEILKHGDIQLTTEQRRTILDEKIKQIANTISKQGVDPKTKLPHPLQRIINAMEQAKVRVDPFKPVDVQMEDILKKLEPVIAISMERIKIAVKIPMDYAGKASSLIRSFANIQSEEWKGDGWYALLEIPAGMQGEIYQKLNDLTKGTVEVQVVK